MSEVTATATLKYIAAKKHFQRARFPVLEGDDITRGLGQLAEALAYGYNQVALVTTLRNAKRIDPAVFDKLGLILLGIDSKGNVKQVYPTYA